MSHIEVKVLVPEARLADFYKAYSEWLKPTESDSETTERRTQRRRTSSYALLGEHLDGRSEGAVTLTFSDIENILERPLPASAYRHRAWWANTDSHSQAAEWLNRGWRASMLDLDQETLTFKRVS